MGFWIKDKYYYTVNELRNIALDYREYLDVKVGGQCLDSNRKGLRYDVSRTKDDIRKDMLSSKIDFDRALNALGRGHWSGIYLDEGDFNFETYHSFGRKQKVVIADILGEPNYRLELLGFYDIQKFKIYAYVCMVRFLNGT